MPFPPFERIHPDIEYSELVLVPGGTFMMGSDDPGDLDREKPVHAVTLPDFAIGKYPVTQTLWTAIMGDNPAYFQGANRPVEQVSWEDAQRFLQKLNADTRLAPGQHFRLPSEAEWEYAARGGQQSGGHRYAGSNVLDEVGWYDVNSHGQTQPVGLKLPNELGLYDLSGNVLEWCADERHVIDWAHFPDGSAWVELRGLRGGSWSRYAQFCRPSYRSGYNPTIRDNYVGLRVVLFFPPVSWFVGSKSP